jgi:hypothetical protein
MSDDNWGAAEPIRQGIHDLVSKFTSVFGAAKPSAPQTDHDAAVADINKKANDDRANAATASFAAAAAKMKSEGHTYDSNRPQVQVRSRYSK